MLLIGPFKEQAAAYQNHPRLRVLGARDYAELPRYLKYWEVSLIPFVLNEVTRHINPTKLLEVVEIGKQLLMTRGALTTFSIANDVSKYFAIIPAAFAPIYLRARYNIEPVRQT